MFDSCDPNGVSTYIKGFLNKGHPGSLSIISATTFFTLKKDNVSNDSPKLERGLH